MPGPTATAGVVGVPCSSATDRTTATAARSAGVGWFPFQTPLKSPLVQGGTLFSSNVAPQRGMKNSFAFDEPSALISHTSLGDPWKLNRWQTSNLDHRPDLDSTLPCHGNPSRNSHRLI